VSLSDGTTVSRGDPVGEFHIRSSALVESARHSRWDVLEACRGDLRALACWVESPECPATISAFYGVTLLGKGAARLGFVTHPLPVTLYRRFERLYLSGLLLLYSNEGQGRYNRGETRRIYPEEVWLTRAELLRRYGEPAGLS
jgi:hypothetical protein